MATKICIIEVDLTSKIPQIIANGAEKLSKTAQAELDAALEAAQLIKALKEQKANLSTKQKAQQDNLIDEVYQALLDAGEIGLTALQIMNMIENQIGSLSAFTAKMKGKLDKEGNNYILEKHKIHGTPHYSLSAVKKPFQQPPQPI